MLKRISGGLCVAVLGSALGCGGNGRVAPPRNGLPLGLQMVRSAAQLQKYPFFTLLSFESQNDPIFVKTEGPPPQLDGMRSHTGAASLVLGRGTRSAVVKFPALHSGREWPGPWTLVGAYFYAQRPQRLTASYEVEGKALAAYTVEIPGGEWTPVMLDVAEAIDQKPTMPIGVLRFTFGEGLAEPIWCDDVLEMNNTTAHVEPRSPGGFAVRERGFQYTVECAERSFREVFKTPEALRGGWVLQEANEIRAHLVSRGMPMSRVPYRVIYADGRLLINGIFEQLGASPDAPALAAAHAAPASISVAQGQGRLERNAPGDANNDGYCEAMGTYHVIAAGPRMEFVVTPGGAPVVRPVIEVRDLPAGKVLVTMEGRLVERVVRLEDGRVLMELPGTLERGTTVNVAVRQ